MKICLEVANLNESQVRNWLLLWTVLYRKINLPSVLSSTAHQIFKASNELSGFHHSEQCMHFHSRSGDISAIIIEIKTRNTLKWMLCFFKCTLPLFIKAGIGKTDFPLSASSRVKLVRETKYHILLLASVIVCIIHYQKYKMPHLNCRLLKVSALLFHFWRPICLLFLAIVMSQVHFAFYHLSFQW